MIRDTVGRGTHIFTAKKKKKYCLLFILIKNRDLKNFTFFSAQIVIDKAEMSDGSGFKNKKWPQVGRNRLYTC